MADLGPAHLHPRAALLSEKRLVLLSLGRCIIHSQPTIPCRQQHHHHHHQHQHSSSPGSILGPSTLQGAPPESSIPHPSWRLLSPTLTFFARAFFLRGLLCFAFCLSLSPIPGRLALAPCPPCGPPLDLVPCTCCVCVSTRRPPPAHLFYFPPKRKLSREAERVERKKETTKEREGQRAQLVEPPTHTTPSDQTNPSNLIISPVRPRNPKTLLTLSSPDSLHLDTRYLLHTQNTIHSLSSFLCRRFVATRFTYYILRSSLVVAEESPVALVKERERDRYFRNASSPIASPFVAFSL